MIKKIVVTAFLALAFLVTTESVQALQLDDGLTDAGGVATYNTTRTAADTVGLLIKAVVGILGVVFLVLTLYAGITWMTAGGDEKKVTKAKGILVSSVIGLVICLTAYTITSFVIDQIQSTQQGVVTVPST